VFMLAAPLAIGRYLGEESIARLRGAAPPADRSRVTGSRLPARPKLRHTDRLIASNLAGRAPPATFA
jgi:hypothetical protein